MMEGLGVVYTQTQTHTHTPRRVVREGRPDAPVCVCVRACVCVCVCTPAPVPVCVPTRGRRWMVDDDAARETAPVYGRRDGTARHGTGRHGTSRVVVVVVRRPRYGSLALFRRQF